MLALRDNVLAIQQGDASAPDIQTNAYADLSVTEAKLASNSVTNAKIANDAVTSVEVDKTVSSVYDSGLVTATYTFPSGIFLLSGVRCSLNIFISGVWEVNTISGVDSVIISNGSNVRISLSSGQLNYSFKYQKFI